MAEVSGNTLIMAIQAVDAEVQRFAALTNQPNASAQLQLILFDYQKTAEELKAAYTVACREEIDLPPYEQLVRG